MTPHFGTMRLLVLAAELRAAGKSWDVVAARLARSPETCKRWPGRYRLAWEEILDRAQRGLLGQACAEAIALLRNHLRILEAKDSRDAAKALLSAATRLQISHNRKPEKTNDDPIDSFGNQQITDFAGAAKALVEPATADEADSARDRTSPD